MSSTISFLLRFIVCASYWGTIFLPREKMLLDLLLKLPNLPLSCIYECSIPSSFFMCCQVTCRLFIVYLIVLPSFTEKVNSVFSVLPGNIFGKSTNSKCKSLLSPDFLFAFFDLYVHPYARSHQLKNFCLCIQM